jgi:hypothetical protein
MKVWKQFRGVGAELIEGTETETFKEIRVLNMLKVVGQAFIFSIADYIHSFDFLYPCQELSVDLAKMCP